MRKYIAQHLYYLLTLVTMFGLLTAVGTPLLSYMIVVLLSGALYGAAKKSVEIEMLHRELEWKEDTRG